MTQEQINEVFREAAEVCRNASKHTLGVDLAYDEASLLQIDDIISKAWPQNSDGDISKRCQIWGSFLGECLRQIHGGSWVRTDIGWEVKIGGVGLNVFAKIEKRFRNGMADSVSFFYTTFKRQLQNAD
jgi:hypothetical protein